MSTPSTDDAFGARGLTGRNVIIGSSLKVASLLVVLLTPIVAARLLPPSGVAQVMIAVSLGTMVGVVLPMGLPLSLSFLVAQVRVDRVAPGLLTSKVRNALIYLALAMLVLLTAIALPWALQPSWFFIGATRAMLMAVVVIGTARATTKVLAEVNKGYGDVNVATVAADLLGPVLGVLGMVFLSISHSGLTVTWVLWCLAGGWLLTVAFAARRTPIEWRASRPYTSAQPIPSVGALAVVSVLNVGIQQAHIVISGFALGLDDAGSFTTAARLATLTGAPLMIISTLASPDIGIALHSRDASLVERVEAQVRRLTGAMFIAATGLLLMYVVAGRELLRFLFGNGYEAGYVELLILAVGPLGSLLAGVAGLTLVLSGDRRRVLRDTLIGSIGAVCAMLTGAQFGGIGLAVGYTFGQLLINTLLLRSCVTHTGMNPLANPSDGAAWAWSLVTAGRMTSSR